mmetsp:Transcript_4973/g.7309  ORF Transcript_4973/g.7309 Transcript_4973/m.7309 type:complete len:134 (-) Transcript_4973:388-789(-)
MAEVASGGVHQHQMQSSLIHFHQQRSSSTETSSSFLWVVSESSTVAGGVLDPPKKLSSARYIKVENTTRRAPKMKLDVKTNSKKCTERKQAEIKDAAMANPLSRLSANFITAVTSKPPSECRNTTVHVQYVNP